MRQGKKGLGFSILELLIIIFVLVLIIIVVVIKVNPSKILQKSRDAQRFSDLSKLVVAVNLYLADNHNFEKLKGPYSSIDAGFTNDEARQKVDSYGWLPLNFLEISSGAPLDKLPLDPINDQIYHYRLGVSVAQKTYEINGLLEHSENKAKQTKDGGNNPNVYEVGTDLTIL